MSLIFPKCRTVQYVWAVLFLLSLSISSQAQKVLYRDQFTVAKDSSGDFTTIQEAVNAVRDLSQQTVVIHIKNGVYQEKIVIPQQKSNITLEGENRDSTIIENGDYSGKPIDNGKDAMGLNKFTTYTSYTVLVHGKDFTARNLTIKNTAGPVGQAVALNIDADRAQVINCNLLGNQDTLYAAEGRQYYANCTITGTTDFIFGKATALFKECTIVSKINSYVTAAATDSATKFGFVFFKCRLIAEAQATKVFLGRPWRPYAKTVYIQCYLGEHIRPEGWDNWRDAANEKTAFYAEQDSYGPGANPQQRVSWSHQLSKKEAQNYTVKNIFGNDPIWIPSSEK